MRFLTLMILTTYIRCAVVKDNWLTDDFIEEINAKANQWTAEKNLFTLYTAEQMHGVSSLMGFHPDPSFIPPRRRYPNARKIVVPDNFDARRRWPHCPSIGTIRNQGLCGSSWAFAAAEVMTDRLCIASGGMTDFIFSTQELISCCQICGDGCKGGYIYSAFEYWNYNGIPSGGEEQKTDEVNMVQGPYLRATEETPVIIQHQGCIPYTAKDGVTPLCLQKCRPGYNKSWEEDIRHGVAAYHVEPEPLQIQAEIMNQGPVAATLDIYQDFFAYKEGIYEHISWELVGHLGVKIIGWGVERTKPYWLVATSWGNNFGMNGLVKVLRGSNHCGIEYEVVGGIPNSYE